MALTGKNTIAEIGPDVLVGYEESAEKAQGPRAAALHAQAMRATSPAVPS
jgi:hypothetical protein